jgi:hypothetical protein
VREGLPSPIFTGEAHFAYLLFTSRLEEIHVPFWEIVAHLSAWDEVVARRVTESLAIEMPEAGNFPPVTAAGPAAWDQALAELDRRHRALRKVIAHLDPSRLDEAAARKNYSLAVMLHGVPNHTRLTTIPLTPGDMVA